MRIYLFIAAALAGAVVAGLWFFTAPVGGLPVTLPARAPDLANGEIMFNVGGCASCHATPNANPDKLDRRMLGGGLALVSPFGTFYVPNISPDPTDGIGNWPEAGFIGALWNGVAWDGHSPPHYLYPAFPYTSYRQMRRDDVRDLFAYLKTLPAVAGRARGHDLAFPFSIRRLIGGWDLLFLRGAQYTPDATKSAQWNRGAYLVNGPGHCAECHSPRNVLGAIVESQRFAGGPTPDGKGWVPNITPVGLQHWGKDDVAWSAKDIAGFLSDGQYPDGDYAGGAMAEVVRNTSLLPATDRAAIAAYVATLPPREGPKPPKKK